MVLIHGFGASGRHWRHALPALATGAAVVALDLLGFGASDKPPSCLADEAPTPGSVRYGFALWAEQVADLVEALDPPASARRRVHLVGNSIGGMVAMAAALLLRKRLHAPEQVILLDCAQRRLDDRRLGELPPSARWGRPALKALVRQRWLIAPRFRLLARPAFIRQVLRQAYPSGAHVDDELVSLLHGPSTTAGAVESFRGFVNLFSDHLATDLLAELSTPLDAAAPAIPVRMIWGEADPWEAVEEARRWAATYACIQDLEILPGVGHCPQDEAPQLVNPILRRWILGSAGPDDNEARSGAAAAS